ncbi:hypothetical protein ACH5RR_010672 [Cinchona calisaya]|uniref:FAF domain-containing protein n=1 Tax=Cinchona calisaya TaxID=153742 RepID=A0ABD3AJL7_9GENT
MDNNMSSSGCQGLQSCLKPGLIEPHVLIQNLAPPKPNFSQSSPWPEKPNVSRPQQELNEIIQDENNKNINIVINKYFSFANAEHERNKDGDSVWSSIDALSKTCQRSNQSPEADQGYIHPLVKRSSSTLSTKSLEMCTESLGSETGSSIDESIDDFPTPLLKRLNFERIQRSRSRAKKMGRSVGFPPPLTSISGSDGVQVRPHREGGRLVLKAVTVSSCTSYFQAERANGRLRLKLLMDGYAEPDNIEFNDNEQNGEVDQENENADEEEEVESEDADDDVEDDGKSSEWEDDDLGVNDENVVGYEMGVEELPRPSSCKEGGSTRNKGMPSWPFRVAIS